MYRVLVADDEMRIRKGLSRFIDNCELPVEVCAQAGDGDEALRYLKELRPDIVLLDICMPYMDGLEFLAEVKRLGLNEHCRFIVLTGYEDFSFARQSVALHAFAYLLKPIDEDELLTYLRQAINELAQEYMLERRNDRITAQFEANRDILRQAFYRSWIDGLLTEDAWNESAAFWNLNWPERAWLTLIKPDFEYSDVLYGQERTLALLGVCGIAEEMLDSLELLCSAEHDDGFAAMLTVQAPPDALIERINGGIAKYLGLTCQIECRALNEPPELCPAVRELLRKMDEKTRFNPLIDKLRGFMEENYHDPELNLTDVSRALSVSKSHLARLIKSAFSTTYIGYLTGIRLRRAIELMASPQNKLSWIAMEVGYSNLHYFSYAFKKHTGMSPSAYREKMNGI